MKGQTGAAASGAKTVTFSDAAAVRVDEARSDDTWVCVDCGSSNRAECGFRALGALWGRTRGFTDAQIGSSIGQLCTTVRSACCDHLEQFQSQYAGLWELVKMDLSPGREGGDVPTTWREYVKATRRPRRQVDGRMLQIASEFLKRHIVVRDLRAGQWRCVVSFEPRSCKGRTESKVIRHSTSAV